jgi:cytochrome P450
MQTRMRNEIRHVMKSSKEVCTAQLMDAMKYLHWFVMENARFYPSIPGNWRECMRDTSVCGQNFAKGTQIIVPAYHVNRSKENWGEDAEEFVPERWAPERLRKGAEHDGSLMTYSVGHKSCIGKEYSLRAIKVVLIALIGNFEFQYDGPDPFKDLVPGITLRPRGGFRCMVTKASEW